MQNKVYTMKIPATYAAGIFVPGIILPVVF